MNYSPMLEVQQRAQKLSQEAVNLVCKILEKDILSIKIKPGSFDFESFVSEHILKFVGEINGEKVYGNFIIRYKKNENKGAKNVCELVVDSLEFKVEGSMKKMDLIFDNKLNIISCTVSSLNKGDDALRFLNIDNSQENCAKINYYDSEATNIVNSYIRTLCEKKKASYSDYLIEEYFPYNGLMPDRETVIEVDSQEELLDIIISFWENAEVTEKIHRGEILLIKDNKGRKNVEN